jgi:prophage antirepressor-like protein
MSWWANGPDRETLFIASQVARAAGLANPSNVIWQYRKKAKEAPPVVLMGELPEIEASPMVSSSEGDLESTGGMVSFSGGGLPVDPSGRRYQAKTVLMPEHATYLMLLRGDSPQSEPFRKWVTEVVLPSLRKTGSYSMHDSEVPKVIEWTGDMAKLADIINQAVSSAFVPMVDLIMERVTAQNLETREQILSEVRGQTLSISQDIRDEMDALRLPAPSSEKSPYEGSAMVHLAERKAFDSDLLPAVGAKGSDHNKSR